MTMIKKFLAFLELSFWSLKPTVKPVKMFLKLEPESLNILTYKILTFVVEKDHKLVCVREYPIIKCPPFLPFVCPFENKVIIK